MGELREMSQGLLLRCGSVGDDPKLDEKMPFRMDDFVPGPVSQFALVQGC
jgi:hypothetical protein